MLLQYVSSNLVACVLVSWSGSTWKSGYSSVFCKHCDTNHVHVKDISCTLGNCWQPPASTETSSVSWLTISAGRRCWRSWSGPTLLAGLRKDPMVGAAAHAIDPVAAIAPGEPETIVPVVLASLVADAGTLRWCSRGSCWLQRCGCRCVRVTWWVAGVRRFGVVSTIRAHASSTTPLTSKVCGHFLAIVRIVRTTTVASANAVIFSREHHPRGCCARVCLGRPTFVTPFGVRAAIGTNTGTVGPNAPVGLCYFAAVFLAVGPPSIRYTLAGISGQI